MGAANSFGDRKWFEDYEVAAEPVPIATTLALPHFWMGVVLVLFFFAATYLAGAPGARARRDPRAGLGDKAADHRRPAAGDTADARPGPRPGRELRPSVAPRRPSGEKLWRESCCAGALRCLSLESFNRGQ